MWYCAQDPQGTVPGDDILYAESPNLNGPFTAPGGGDPLIVFEGRGDGSFEGQHTCDPSIVKVDGSYYMYYGAGQFAWRSADPTFATGTEVFTAEGWQASTRRTIAASRWPTRSRPTGSTPTSSSRSSSPTTTTPAAPR